MDGWATIVVGGTLVAQAIARGLAARSTHVVVADAGDSQTLLAYGIEGASAIYACEAEVDGSGVDIATVPAAEAMRLDFFNVDGVAGRAGVWALS